jgi:hypothetical protein
VVRFYLGTHCVSQDFWDAEVPLFVSRRRLVDRRGLPTARAEWALDSGGFTELSLFGEWRTSEDQYVRDVERFRDEMGELAWVAPQDWMCEPFMLEKTGLDVYAHIDRTVANFVRLRDRLGSLVVPVLQGWTLDHYLACAHRYEDAGVDLAAEPTVGLGTICRRQDMVEAAVIVRRLAVVEGLPIHGFGVKVTGIRSYGDILSSSDSMAWSYNGRRNPGRCPNGRASCANCLHHALAWRTRLLSSLDQLQMEVAA